MPPYYTQKKLEEIIDTDIIQFAIICAEAHGWTVGAVDCRVRAIQPARQTVAEIGLGISTFRPFVTQWEVHIIPKSPPNRFSSPLTIVIEFGSGYLYEEIFSGPDYPTHDTKKDSSHDILSLTIKNIKYSVE